MYKNGFVCFSFVHLVWMKNLLNVHSVSWEKSANALYLLFRWEHSRYYEAFSKECPQNGLSLMFFTLKIFLFSVK